MMFVIFNLNLTNCIFCAWLYKVELSDELWLVVVNGRC